jgi:cytidylate kinase
MTLVALSASYGAAGSVVGPALAERLGVPFLDRAIPLAVAERLHVPVDQAVAHEDQAGTSLLERLLRGFIASDNVAPTAMPASASDEFHEATVAALREQAATGEGVILGRAATLVLREDPRVLRARLDGPPERRVRLAMDLGEDVDEETARRALRATDQAHEAYARRFYDARLDDPSLYHVIVDPTAVGVDAAIEMLATAARSLHAAGTGRFRRD